jgi:cAMP-dependent protein kinase regulator
MYIGFLSQVPVLKTLSDMELMALADALVEDEYLGDSIVCHEGERGDHFFIVKDGEAIVTKKNFETGYENVVASLKKGKHFGEVALLTHKPRTATVRSAPKQTLKVLVIGIYKENVYFLFPCLT